MDSRGSSVQWMVTSDMTRRDLVLAAFQPAPQREQILRRMELVMGPLPSGARSPLDPATESVERAEGYTRALLSYCPEAGDRVPAYLLSPTIGKPPFPAAICLHQTTSIGKAEPAGLGGNPTSITPMSSRSEVSLPSLRTTPTSAATSSILTRMVTRAPP